METILKNTEQKSMDRDERRSMVLEGVEQIKQGKTHNFDEVCTRLEKKYRNAIVHNGDDRFSQNGFGEFG